MTIEAQCVTLICIIWHEMELTGELLELPPRLVACVWGKVPVKWFPPRPPPPPPFLSSVMIGEPREEGWRGSAGMRRQADKEIAAATAAGG